jgi:hypothetical protein
MELPRSATLVQLISGYRRSQALYVAAKLGIADVLSSARFVLSHAR